MGSSHIGPMILETDWQVTYHENENIQDEECKSVMIYCRVPQLPWDTQLWKISVYIDTRWDKIFNRSPHAQSLYYWSKRRRRIMLQGQHGGFDFTDCIRRCLNFACMWRVVLWTEGIYMSYKYVEVNWIHSRYVTDTRQFHWEVCHIRWRLLHSQILVAST
jgi:hypothetical protein